MDVSSTLHQCIVQWVGDEVEVVRADDITCVAMAEAHEDLQEGEVCCFSGRDLYYISVSQHRFIPVNVKSTVVSQLENVRL
jgi:hypothetical protein